uniref:hypothetical protein n=1 Tax=Nonomuraea sp. CA-251285 TaxID=3240002 RepID=UPI003F49370E
MSAGQWTFHVDAGATWQVALTVADDSGQPVDLTGYMARLQAREHITSPTPVIDLTAPDIAVDGPAGVLSWTVADEVTAAWTWRHAVYNLEIESGGGLVRRLLKGEIHIDPEVTR